MLPHSRLGDGLVQRGVGALRLDLQLYDEISADAAGTGQALRIVLLAGLSNGVSLVRRFGSAGIIAGVGAALLGWVLWTAVIWLVAKALRCRPEGRSLLRALGFANAPGVFLIFGALPIFGPFVRVIVVIWLVATTVRAAQAVFALTMWRALIISIVGFVVYLILGAASAQFAS